MSRPTYNAWLCPRCGEFRKAVHFLSPRGDERKICSKCRKDQFRADDLIVGWRKSQAGRRA